MNAQLQTYPASEFNLLSNGRLVPGASTFDVINPATERTSGRLSREPTSVS